MREREGRYEIIKESAKALDSKLIGSVVESTGPQKLLMAHIRLATIGVTRIENCHPYTGKDLEGRTWTLIHNGTIYSGSLLTPYITLQKGETDSERVFLYLMDRINNAILDRREWNSHHHIVPEARPELSDKERFDIVDQVTRDLSPRNKLNLMIYDEELLYVHNNMEDTLYYRRLEDGVLIVTSPLTKKGWRPFPLTRLHAFRDGEVTFRGRDHGAVFVPNLEYITAMAAMGI